MVKTRTVLVFSVLFALSGFADEAPPSPPAPTPSAPAAPVKTKGAKKPSQPPATGSANMIVTKDAETGELRPATPAEREKLLGRQPLAAPEHKVVTLPDGSVMLELGEADRSYAVATRNSDGTISRACVHGAAEATKAVTAGASPAPAPAPQPAPKTDR